MKNPGSTFLSLLFAFFLATNLTAQQDEDLLNVLKKETEAFANANFEEWQSYWCHTENARFSYTDRNGVVAFHGWAAIGEAFKKSLEGMEKLNPNFKRENVKIEKTGKMAFITFDQYDQFSGNEGHNQESRVMKKTKEGWKILSIEVVNMTSFDKTGKELHRILLASFKPEARAEDIRYIFDQFNAIAGDVEGMTSCNMMKNEDTGSPFQYTFIMTFRSDEALAAYESHKNHQAAVDKWMVIGDKIKVINSWE